MKLIIIFLFCFLLYVIFTYNKTKNKLIHAISIDSCNCLKGLMAISIVLHHLSQKTDIFILKELFGSFGFVCVGCFFFISGYGLYTSYLIKGQSYLEGYFFKRFRKLIIPFLFVILLYQLVNIGSYKHILDGLAVGSVIYILPYSWYVFCAILFYFTFYYIFKYIADEKNKIICLFIFTSILWFVFKFILNWPGYWYGNLFLFPLGFLFKYLEKFIYKKSCLYIIYVCILTLCLNLFNVEHTGLIKTFLNSLVLILPLTIFNISSKYLNFLGTISYEIYLIQGVIFFLIKKLNTYNEILFIFISIISIVLLSYIIKCLLHYIDSKLFSITK